MLKCEEIAKLAKETRIPIKRETYHDIATTIHPFVEMIIWPATLPQYERLELFTSSYKAISEEHEEARLGERWNTSDWLDMAVRLVTMWQKRQALRDWLAKCDPPVIV